MPINLNLDDRLVERARKLGRHKTDSEAITAALEEYVRRREQARLLDLFGKIDFDPRYDYKAARPKR